MEKSADHQPMVSARALGEIVRDFSNYLSLQREMGINSLDLAPGTIKLMEQWQRGKFRPMVKPARPGGSSFLEKKQTSSLKPLNSLDTQTMPLETQSAKPSDTVPQISSKGGDGSGDGASGTQNITMPVIKGRGTGDAGIFFLCEVSSLDENQQPDITGGPAGDLFLKILKAMKLDVDKAYIISFQPPVSQPDSPGKGWQKEIKTHVFEKIKQLNPRVICSMGENALKVMLGNDARLADGEGQFQNMATALFIPTFHPAQLINDPSLKRPVWESMKRILKHTG
ncbi:uracil-DNA glycosylase, family 4 [Desulfocicer vacuolatum DSM 3385]|uniref:Uracil-DNA glycosylase, family 4 n=1 Tax=Desulfocicer vacuolatum DSM 3385 TaxID=1121400 RepID=A0A1W1ZG10_9BACT|nr:uracil-DNA glycosylase family protein [Desulfocicer vacuolatum]SMC47430.1 uracil-DNA glycosylase, family 4 [Desulfocicer vacuolatum DSM 3385]